MRCLVTGVAGFVGSHLAERLLADGHEVYGIDSFTNDYDRSFKEQNLEGPRSWPLFCFIEDDLMEVALQPLLEGMNWIFHQAGQEKGRAGWGAGGNVLTTLRLLEAALRFGWVQRFIYASSSAVYGKAAHLPIHEDELEQPQSLHGVTKLAAENLCSLYYHRFGLPTVSLRYFSVYGPRQRPDMAFHRFCRAIVCHEPLSLYGGGYQTRDFTYVEDVVEANIRAAVSDVAGKVINIGSGTSVTLRSTIELLEEISGARTNVIVDDSQYDDVRHICADIQRAQQLLDYRPSMDLRDGLAHEFEFMRRLYEHRPNSSVRQDGSNERPVVLSDGYAVISKAALVNLAAGLKPQTNPVAEPSGETVQRTEPQMSTLANEWQDLRDSQFHINLPIDKRSEYSNLRSSVEKVSPVGLTATPTLQMSVAELMADAVPEIKVEGVKDYGVASKATTPNLPAALEPETRQAESQMVLQINQADRDMAAPIAADVAQGAEPQANAWMHVWQQLQAPQRRMNVPSGEEGQRVPLSPAVAIETRQKRPSHWVPSSRLSRSAVSYAEQNHMAIAIITLLLVSLLILGGYLVISSTHFIASPSAVTAQPGAASSAAITITADASKTFANTFSLTAVPDKPDVAQHQIKARQIFATTQPVSKSVPVASALTSVNVAATSTTQPTSGNQNTTTPSSVVQQSDIDTAANDLETVNMPAAVSMVQSQLAKNEQLVSSPQCQPQVSANHKAGDIADAVTVTVVFSCSGEAYDRDTAEKMAAQELIEQVKNDIGDVYVLSDQIVTTVKKASISDASQGIITVPVDARGTWVLQLSTDQQRAWASSLTGKTKHDAQSLLQQRGIKLANIQLQGGDGRTLPTNATKIIIKVQPIVGP